MKSTYKDINKIAPDRRNLTIGVIPCSQHSDPNLVVWDQTEVGRIYSYISRFAVRVNDSIGVDDGVCRNQVSVDLPWCLRFQRLSESTSTERNRKLTPTLDHHCDVKDVGFIHRRVVVGESIVLFRIACPQVLRSLVDVY